MSSPIFQTLTDELLGEIEAAANDVRGWTMREYFQEPEEGFLPADWEWYVGSIDEDGNRYPLINVNAHQYDSEDSEKLAKYYAMVNRDDVLAMLTELRTLRDQVKALQSDANSWQSGYDEGRRMAGKHRLSEIEQLRAENAELLRVVKDVRLRVLDTTDQLQAYGFNGDRLYGLDEWSVPIRNLNLAVGILDKAMEQAK